MSKCAHCDEAFEGGDRIHPRVTPTVHYECGWRFVMGSLAHLQGTCGCYVAGSNAGDPPGMSLRQAAQAAYDYWLSLTIPERELVVCRPLMRIVWDEGDDKDEGDHAYQA